MATVLEEKDAIRELMHAYCFRCDTRDADGLAALFTEDCVWDGGPFGRKNGPEELKQFPGPVVMGAAEVECGKYPDAPAVCNDQARFYQYEGKGRFKPLTDWIRPPR